MIQPGLSRLTNDNKNAVILFFILKKLFNKSYFTTISAVNDDAGAISFKKFRR